MSAELTKWQTQIRKGYLELCILGLIQKQERYGFELLELLRTLDLEVKEGTLYPLLNRMTADKILRSKWQTEGAKGHPRKFYFLTASGKALLAEMRAGFAKMVKTHEHIMTEN